MKSILVLPIILLLSGCLCCPLCNLGYPSTPEGVVEAMIYSLESDDPDEVGQYIAPVIKKEAVKMVAGDMKEYTIEIKEFNVKKITDLSDGRKQVKVTYVDEYTPKDKGFGAKYKTTDVYTLAQDEGKWLIVDAQRTFRTRSS